MVVVVVVGVMVARFSWVFFVSIRLNLNGWALAVWSTNWRRELEKNIENEFITKTDLNFEGHVISKIVCALCYTENASR